MQKIIVFILISLFSFTGKAGELKLDDYLNQLYQSHIIPGFSVVVVQKEKVVFEKGYGVEYIDGNTPMTSETSSAIGSLAKSFTAMAIMQLVEKGKINLDKPVVEYIPWFRTANKEFSDRITVRMLINNTSGLKAPVIRNRDISDNAVMSLIRSMESTYLTSNPGESYEYSNDGFALAGLLISSVSGMSYENYLEENIFKPLEMNRTTNNPDDFKKLHVLYGHYPGINKAIPVFNDDDILREYVAAGSILRSSAGDIGNYLLALLNDGKFKGKQILSKKSINEMWKSYASFPGISVEDGGNGLPISYGLGWFIGNIDGKNCVFHGGNRRTMSSMTIICPEQNIAVSFIANIDLTFIDKYKYPNMINIANNIIRVFLGEPVSDFAIPIVADPTINDFKLPKKVKNQYTGKYLLTKGNDWVYQGSELLIEQKEENLIATISKGNQIIDQFVIDFITPKTAVSRNLSMARKIQFKFLNNGEISDLYFGGLKYSRLSEGYYSRFRKFTSPDKSISFYFPKSSNITWVENGFSAHYNISINKIKVIGKVFNQEKSFSEYFEEIYPGQNILHTGQEAAEIFGIHFWNELALVSKGTDGKDYHFLCKTKMEGQNYVFVISTKENLTLAISDLIPTLLGSFHWKIMK